MTSASDRRAADDTDLVGLYVYGIVQAVEGRVPQGLTGLDDAPVKLVEVDTIAAAVGAVAFDRPPGRRADLMAHSHVLDALAADGPVVPVQFGSMLEDSADIVAELLEPMHDRWLELLTALRGRQQFNLRGTYHEASVLEEVVTENPQIADLRARTRELPEDLAHPDRVRLGELVAKAMADKRARDTEMVLELVLPQAVSFSQRERAGVDHLLDCALLVDESRRAEFEDVLESVAEAVHERIRLQLVGPVPPYDFVEGDWWV